MPDLGKAYVQIVPSAEGISGSIEKALGGEANSAGVSAGNKIVGALKKVIATAGIGAAFKKSIEAGANLQQSFGGLETIYGAAADKAKEYAVAASQAGISANSFAEQAVSFGASLKQAFEGDTTKAVEAANTAIMDMTDNAAKMGTPIENIQMAYQGFAKQNYTMLDNLKLGYGGTKTEMERLLADAQEISGVEYDMSNLGDVYDAIHVIQGELGLTGVAAQEASETLSGSFGAMKAAGENLLASLTLGQDVVPAMQTLVTSAISVVSNLIPAIGNILKGLPVAIKTAVTQIHPVLINGLKSATDAIKQNLPTMLQDALHNLLNFSDMLLENAGELVDAGLEMVKSIADGIIQSIPTIIETVPTIISNFANIINNNAPKIIKTGLTIIKALAKGLIQAIPVLIANIPKILTAIWDVFTAFQWINLGKTVIKKLGDGIKGSVSSIKSHFKDLTSNAKETIVSGFEALKGKVSSIWNSIKTAITNPIEAAKTAVSNAISKIKSLLSGTLSFPHVKLPHFSISGKFSLNPPSIPKIGVSWYRKAEDNPYLFTNPTLFGAGEGKDEVMYGKAALMRDMTKAVEKADRRGGATFNNYFTINNADNPEAVAQAITTQLKLQMRSA